MQKLFDKLQNFSGDMIFYGIVAIAVLIGLGVAIKILKGIFRSQKRSGRLESSLTIDIEKLPVGPMPKEGPMLEFYNWPVRVALVVFAPAGTGAEKLSLDRWNDAFDSIVPGLARVIDAQRPTIRTWPAQLSASGFASKFFQHVPLPGDNGKGSVFSAAAGTFILNNRPMLVGMVFEAAEPDRHGQYTVNNANEWLNMLRVRSK
ncbi:MAG: hypothetical protein PVH19_01365 [Planctomycetia bacterium]|jgi:hypothetical protein